MPRIPFPNVPNVPGVPQVLRRLPAGPPPILASAAGIAQLVRAFTSKNVWGVFKHVDPFTVVAQRIPAITPDSFLDFEFSQETSISSAPVQRGSFADYNRVASPFEIKLRMSKGGSIQLNKTLPTSLNGLKDSFTDPVQARADFLDQIAALDTTQLYDIFTPEKTYLNCNFVRAEVSRRGEKGAFWLSMVDVYFREIREVTATYVKTVIASPTNPDAKQQQNNGTQQGVATNATPPPSVTR